jgi:hypothetical protein
VDVTVVRLTMVTLRNIDSVVTCMCYAFLMTVKVILYFPIQSPETENEAQYFYEGLP